MDANTTTAELINLAAKYDNGDPAVTVDVYDAVIEALMDREDEGDEAAHGYLVSVDL